MSASTQPIPSSGTTITAPGGSDLTAQVICGSLPYGIIVQADNVTIDLK